jgi:hypothetical protein
MKDEIGPIQEKGLKHYHQIFLSDNSVSVLWQTGHYVPMKRKKNQIWYNIVKDNEPSV